jgi:protein-disulfide isomerase
MEEEKQENIGEEVEIFVNEQPKKDFILPASIIVAAIMIGGAVVFATLYRGGSAPAAPAGGTVAAGTTPAPSQASTTAILALSPRDAILGNKNAPVTIVEYGDYQCPYCSEYFESVQPGIVKNYLDTGKAKMVFRNLAFLGPESVAAAQAAECAEDQNQLWPYHDALYTAKLADFNKGGAEDDGVLSRTLFLKIAAQLHLDMPTFTSCIDTNKYASLVAQEKADGYTVIGAYSTPATFVNGVIVADSNGNSVGANPAAVFAAITSAIGK